MSGFDEPQVILLPETVLVFYTFVASLDHWANEIDQGLYQYWPVLC
jgi:hypothetical protein